MQANCSEKSSLSLLCNLLMTEVKVVVQKVSPSCSLATVALSGLLYLLPSNHSLEPLVKWPNNWWADSYKSN